MPTLCLKASGSEVQHKTNHLFLFLSPGRHILGSSFMDVDEFPQLEIHPGRDLPGSLAVLVSPHIPSKSPLRIGFIPNTAILVHRIKARALREPESIEAGKEECFGDSLGQQGIGFRWMTWTPGQRAVLAIGTLVCRSLPHR